MHELTASVELSASSSEEEQVDTNIKAVEGNPEEKYELDSVNGLVLASEETLDKSGGATGEHPSGLKKNDT